MATSQSTLPLASSIPGDEIIISRAQDRALPAFAMTLFVLALGHAVDLKDGDYGPGPIFWLTIAIPFAVLAILNPRWDSVESVFRRRLPAVLALAIAIEAYYLLLRVRTDSHITLAFTTVAVLGLFQFLELRSILRWSLMIIMVIAFCIAGATAFNVRSKNAGIDVFMFQQTACYALTHGLNPYSFKYPSIYPLGTPYYGPGIVDANGYLTVGCPYPPLSILLTLPGYFLGDVRYSDVAAIGISAAVIAFAPTRRGSDRASRSSAPLAAALLLLMPRAVYVLDLSWTEPLLVLMFSFVMFSALRWPKALPVALGLYLSTKQYTILTLPLLPLLIDRPNHWRTLWRLLLKAFLVVTAINLPFLLWNVRAFWRSLVEFQLMQSFRNDALSYLVFIRHLAPQMPLPAWISLVPLVVIIPVCLRRVASSPAGFAAAVTVVHLFFFAFNKQAFCNYYYFVIATACWSIAAARLPPLGHGPQPTRS
jgi:uncharacterized membrane protein